jgi:hypothetical protein
VDCVVRYRSLSDVVLVWITLEDVVEFGKFIVNIGLGNVVFFFDLATRDVDAVDLVVLEVNALDRRVGDVVMCW